MARTHVKSETAGAFGNSGTQRWGRNRTPDEREARRLRRAEQEAERTANSIEGMALDLYRIVVQVQDHSLELMKKARNVKNTKDDVIDDIQDVKEELAELRNDEDESMLAAERRETLEAELSTLEAQKGELISIHHELTAECVSVQRMLNSMGLAVRKRHLESHKERKARTKVVCRALALAFDEDIGEVQESLLSLPAAEVMDVVLGRPEDEDNFPGLVPHLAREERDLRRAEAAN